MLVYKQAESDAELKQILLLQQANLSKNLTEKEKTEDGFVTVEHSFELLKKMNSVCGHTIVKDKENVVGYALSMHPMFANEIEVLRPMFSELDKLVPTVKEYIVMGQICISKEYRGKGLFRALYYNMQTNLPPSFTKIITEIDTKNIRSLNAHKAIGFKELKRYPTGKKEWSIVVLG